MTLKGLLRLALIALVFVAFQGTMALAGTAITGTMNGYVTDTSGQPIAGASVSAASPGQTVRTVTDAKGFFVLLDLSPDTYALTASKDGYDPSTLYGLTVVADQNTRANVSLRPSAKVIGRVTATAETSVVNKAVTGDLYAVNEQAINNYQGGAGGAETLYSQNGVVGSLPGVVRQGGSGGGYYGQGTLSLRGGSFDQVGYELDGIPLNRGFDQYNATSFLTNGLASLEVYTGGEPADAGRAMSGFINQVIQRGRYPGGADLTLVGGAPAFDHTLQTDVYGASPNGNFSYYLSTLAVNAAYRFNNATNNQGLTLNIPANDAGCADYNAISTAGGFSGPAILNCAQPNALSATISQGLYQSNTYADERDTVANLHWLFEHGGGLQDDLQALYVTGSTVTPQYDAYGGGANVDPALFCEESACSIGTPNPLSIDWPTGARYTGAVGAAFDPNAFTTLTWPSSGGSQGPIPQGFTDNQITQYSIEKLGYTHSLSSSSYIRLFGYQMYSFWTLNQPTEGIVGGTFYQLHDNATGITMNYENQLNAANQLAIDLDYTKDLTNRNNYGNYFGMSKTAGEPGGDVNCGNLALGPAGLGKCGTVEFGNTVAETRGPYNYLSTTTPIFSDAVIADTYKPADKWTFNLGARFDQFKFALMPLQITGPNGLAELAQNENGVCLHGFAYAAGEPCFGYDTNYATQGGSSVDLPGHTNWTNVSGDLNYNEFSPRFGFTYAASTRDVIRFSVGRYVEAPNSAFIEYESPAVWGPGNTVRALNRYLDGLGFTAVHNIQPEDSTNYDLSFEHDFAAGLSAKLTPFYRNTRGQILSLPVNPAQPNFVTGYNYGAARIYGSEFLIRKNRTGDEGLSGTFAATYTQSKIRFTKGATGQSFIDVFNTEISAYNAAHGTSYALLDPNGYYYPSFTQAPLVATPSYVVPFVFNLTLDERTHGFDFVPTFNYQSGAPYGDPALFPDPTGLAPIGPDPYTHTFDAPGSLKGPSWVQMNMAIAHDLGHNSKATLLVTNVFTSIHNHGYPWELPTSDGVISYSDNLFYQNNPLGAPAISGLPQNPAYFGDNYYPYAPYGTASARQFTFSLSTKL